MEILASAPAEGALGAENRSPAADEVRTPAQMSQDIRRLLRENARLRERELARSEELAALLRDLKALGYCVSHDLRAPLRAIEGFSQILEDDFSHVLGAEGARILGVIRNSSGALEQMIDGLMQFLRANSGAPLAMDSIDMTRMASGIAHERTAARAEPKPLVELDRLPAAIADADIVRQVWCHLIDNALKFSSKRPRSAVAISGRIEGRMAIYRVEDNGVGFDMRYADKLFGVFQRLHRPEDFPGAGVGLAIVRRIIGRHGGRVWAESEPDSGARFYFTLPAAAASV